VSFQARFLPYPDLMRALNVYYAAAHVPVLVACLVWRFTRHRKHYPSLRTTLAITTGVCLLVQLVPVAPPRMYPGLGFVDAGDVFGPGVYGKVGTGIADQLSAMPSVHVAWAALVALAVIVASSSRWRWWILAHPILTVVAITATANHWWLDGIVATAILFVAWGIDRAIRATWVRIRARRRPPCTDPDPESADPGSPVLEPVERSKTASSWSVTTTTREPSPATGATAG
jgi:hypothetical protein